MFKFFKKKKEEDLSEKEISLDEKTQESASSEQIKPADFTKKENTIENITTPFIDQQHSIKENNLPLEKLQKENSISFSSLEDTMPSIIEENLEKSADPLAEQKQLSWTQRLKKGLSKSRDKLNKSLASIVGGGQIDEELYEDLEAVLLGADMGISATEHLLKEVRERVSFKGLKNANELKETLREALYELILPLEKSLTISPEDKPFVIMMVGVNGAGKTTSIGKLAKHFQQKGKSIILAAGDTFRAAAVEQLVTWGKRNQVSVISQENGDSAAVCFDTVEAAKARNIDIVLADTAGRLPTQLHLMEEIKKVKKVIKKSCESAPHEIILVLDANIGQNTINQVSAFDEALGLSGLILTKLDGTAKGGVIAALAKTHPIPIRYIGIGEGINDLKPFKAKEFVDALLFENDH